MGDTLVLNNDGLPLSIVPLSTLSWQDAITQWAKDCVDILHVYEDWVVHSPSVTINVPAVVMVRDYVKTSKKVIFSRQNVFIRDEFVCQYCGEKHGASALSLDHINPRSNGGGSSFLNCATACRPCNTKKGSRTDIKPIHDPFYPTYKEMAGKRKIIGLKVPHPSWLFYLDIK